MEESVKKDSLTVLREAVILIKDCEYHEIKELSNHTIHNASIFQDRDSISAAVIIYSISKIMERSSQNRRRMGEELSGAIEDAITLLKKDKIKGYRKAVKNILSIISKADRRLKMFIEEVVEQAEIKKGSKLYEHGLSAAKAAELLGISQWELMGYLGKTRIAEETPVNISKRLDFARSLFRL